MTAKGLDGSTIRNTVNPLRVIFDRHRYSIPVNPTTRLRYPARRDKPRRAVSAEVATSMLGALPLTSSKGDPDRSIRATAFYAGLRKGELQALRVEDVELFSEGRWGLIHVRQGWDKVEGAQEPKSSAGVRTVPIPGQLYEILDEHLLRLARTSGLIFGRTATEPFSYHTVRERSEAIWRKAGLEPADLQLHEARHTYRTLLAAAGIPRDRRDRYSGHSDPTVGGRYEHQLDAQYLDDAQTFGEYLRRADAPTRTAAEALAGGR